MCYDTGFTSMACRAAKYRKSLTQFRRHIKMAAWVFLHLQYKVYEQYVELSRTVEVGTMIDILMSDETRQRLLLQLGRPCNSSITVMRRYAA